MYEFYCYKKTRIIIYETYVLGQKWRQKGKIINLGFLREIFHQHMAKKDEPYIKKTIAHCSFQQLITSSMSQLENNYLTLNVNFLTYSVPTNITN